MARVLNLVDYSLVNEFENLKRPSSVHLNLGKMICRFINLMKRCTDKKHESVKEEDWTWHQVQLYVRKNVSCSMYEFKDNIKKTIALSGSGILEDEFLILKATYLHNPMVLKR